jgi:hypothetical protein
MNIPNEADAGFADQAEPDARDFSGILTPAYAQTGVCFGCAVTAQGSPDMTVAVALGTVRVAGVGAAVAAGNVTITAANATNPRFDLICVDSAGAKSAVAGTAASNPVFPDPAGKVVLASVYVPANDTTINTNQIVDKRIFLAARKIQIKVIDDATVLTTGDGKMIFVVSDDLGGLNLTDADAYVTTVSSSGLPTIQIRNITQTADMLTTRITIDASEFTSYTAATAAVIDTANDDVATGDLIAIDVDVAGTGTKGLGVILTFA